jgi:mono/diheme cytochrome c family protein
MSKHTGHHDHGLGVRGYTFIAVVLGIITYIEYYIVEHPIMASGWTMFWLITLSIAKFIMVVAYFMHLKQDDRTYTGFFSSGMVIAMGTFVALALIFSVESLFWQTRAEEEVHHEAVAVADIAHAEELYHHYCATCHRSDGLGIAGAVPPHAVHAPLLAQADGGVGGRAYMINVVLYGLEGDIEALGETYNGIMPARSNLNDRYVAEILNYTVSAFGNEAHLPEDFTPFTASEVAAIRNQNLAPLDVHALRQELQVPEAEAGMLPRRRGLELQSWRPPPKNQALLLTPDPFITESRTPYVPEAGVMDREEAGPPTPGILLSRPDYEESGEETGVDAIPEEMDEDTPTVGFPFETDEPGEVPDPSDVEQDEFTELTGPEEDDEGAVEQEAPEGDVEESDVVAEGTPATGEEAEVSAETEPADEELEGEEPEGEAAPLETAETAQAEATGATTEVTVVPAQTDEGETTEAEDPEVEESEDEQPGQAQPEAEEPQQQDEAASESDFDWQALGETTYTNCAGCHGANGQGVPGAFPPLAGHAQDLYSAEGGREYLVNVLLYGLQGEITVDGATYNGVMPAWAHLSDEQIAAVINHVVTAWETGADLEAFEPVLPTDVEAERNQGLSPSDVHDMRQNLALE